ncbi:hypothetical protein I8D64_09895 [Brachybacterium sp. MASK1Z-5]|uniref:Uncharacterized protein n=1 Tax=Brachybacterium halotolerans TaxID=2795215 RepID=A0ABS1BAN0_9MICO|nr:hypothetical protein [Brachybacterium halotolerans]MBK0331715.1 hypothetical protein [Brachybacterium halotolerans]
MDFDVDDAATLMTLLDEKRPRRVTQSLLSGWDMLQADVPTRERIESAAAVLVGTGLATVDADWGMQLTAEGARIRRAVPGRLGMRQVPGILGAQLRERGVSRADFVLPSSLYDAAFTAYMDVAARRRERAYRRHWWETWKPRRQK